MGRAIRALLFTHRWMGIIIGLVMTMWCLSGFVMMYSPYPRLQSQEQIAGLSALRWPVATNWHAIDMADETPISSARVEDMGGTSVLRVSPARQPGPRIAQMRATPDTIALGTEAALPPLSQAQIKKIAEQFARNSGQNAAVTGIVPVTIDQWTVQTAKRHQPLHRVDYADGATIYVAGSGEVVQQTTRAERFWGWLGAVPHWLYPTILRQNGEVWSQTVIWASTIGCFLTVTGMVVGIVRLKRNRQGKVGSPFQGTWWWHHMLGLVFGLLTLTWVFSGLVSMNPLGFLDSEAGFAEGQRLSGEMRWGEVRDGLATLNSVPEGTVRIETAPLAGKLYFAAVNRSGQRTRLSTTGQQAPLNRAEVVAALSNGPTVQSLTLMRVPDAYYYTHKTPVTLPVWRAILDDGEETRLYIDADTGRLIRAYDRNGRGFRWLMNGLHSLDLPGLNTQPIWDMVMLPLLAMVTLVCGTGTWMGVNKLRRDARIRRNWRRRLQRDSRNEKPQLAG